MFIKSNAVLGMAYYRAVQSRLDPNITSVEAFEVIKMGLASDFKVLAGLTNLLPEHNDFGRSKQDVIEYNPRQSLIRVKQGTMGTVSTSND